MSTTPLHPAAESTATPQGTPKPHFGTGRSEFVVVAVLYALAIFLTVGTATMDVQGDSVPGPQFFPVLVCIVLYLMATLLAVQILRSPKVPDSAVHPKNGQFSEDMLRDLGQLGPEEKARYDETGQIQLPPKKWKTYSDWRTVGLTLASVVGFVLILELAGWIISAALLFWAVAATLGSHRRVFDLGVGLLFSSIIQLALGAGLGLSLPVGFVGGIL